MDVNAFLSGKVGGGVFCGGTRPWTKPWSLGNATRCVTTSTTAHKAASTAASEQKTPSNGSDDKRSVGQPRATTGTVTDREILAKQRNPEEYLRVKRQNIRTFGIIAHVDHGKSTLADRLLEITGAVPAGSKNQYLDRLPVERARGITVKAQSVTLLHDCAITNERYLLNLIDTPGHADFSFEVSRSLRACDGALLLVDATQGVQAQTIATFYLALENDLVILPVANKVDMENADVESIKTQMVAAFGMDVEIAAASVSAKDSATTTYENPHTLLPTSAKTGLGVPAVLNAICKHVPHPKGVDALDASSGATSTTQTATPLRARLLDCHYDPYRGAVSTIQVVDGAVKVGDKITSHFTGTSTEVLELGFMTPEPLKTTVRVGAFPNPGTPTFYL
jgi:elongation factor 4